MMLDKKQIWSVFLFKFKMSHKIAETLTSPTHLAQELLTNIQGRGGSRSFTKETAALKTRSAVADQWQLTTKNHLEAVKELNGDHSMVI